MSVRIHSQGQRPSSENSTDTGMDLLQSSQGTRIPHPDQFKYRLIVRSPVSHAALYILSQHNHPIILCDIG